MSYKSLLAVYVWVSVVQCCWTHTHSALRVTVQRMVVLTSYGYLSLCTGADCHHTTSSVHFTQEFVSPTLTPNPRVQVLCKMCVVASEWWILYITGSQNKNKKHTFHIILWTTPVDWVITLYCLVTCVSTHYYRQLLKTMYMYCENLQVLWNIVCAALRRFMNNIFTAGPQEGFILGAVYT